VPTLIKYTKWEGKNHGALYRLGLLTSPAWLSLGLQLSYEG